MGKGIFETDFEMSSPMANNFTGQEGFERYGQGEFHQFLSVAKASCAEVRSLLYVAFDIGYLDQDQFQKLLNQTEEVGRIIGALRSSVDRSRKEKESKTKVEAEE